MYYYNRPGINSSINDMQRESVFDNYTQRYEPARYKSQIEPMYDMPDIMSEDQSNMGSDLSEALMIIQNAIKGESEDAAFYEVLISMAPSREDKKIITEIRSNEMKHNKMFKQLYYDLTGKTINTNSTVENVQIANYCDGLQKALMGEQMAVERYRKILFAMQDRKYINMMTEIITDELRHLGLYNYLYSKNKCTM